MPGPHTLSDDEIVVTRLHTAGLPGALSHAKWDTDQTDADGTDGTDKDSDQQDDSDTTDGKS
jgi:hypothetical protein